MSFTTVQRDQPTTERFALSIGGKVYGPYTTQQMKSYVAEGRITASSLISRDGGAWMAASDEPHCAGWLAAAAAGIPEPPVPPPSPPIAPAPRPIAPPRSSGVSARDAFLKELEGVRLKSPSFAGKSEAKAPVPARVANTNPPPVREDSGPAAAGDVQSANMLLVFDLKSRGHGRLEEDIMSIGPATKVMSGCWILHTDLTSGAIRNLLMKHFGATDSIFIVDASRDKTTWFNLGPEVDSHIRKVWRRS